MDRFEKDTNQSQHSNTHSQNNGHSKGNCER